MGTDLSMGAFVLTEEQDRIIIRESWTEHILGWIVCVLVGPGFGFGLLLIIREEIQDPGHLGKDLLLKRLGILQFDPRGPLTQLLAVLCSLLLIVILAFMVWFCCRGLYRKIVYGRLPWILDRSQDLFLRGPKPLRPLSSITHVVISGAQVRSSYIYYVSFATENAQPMTTTVFLGLRDDLFAFGEQVVAVEFAAKVASFLGIRVVNAYDR
jgi:hypothetical protein